MRARYVSLIESHLRGMRHYAASSAASSQASGGCRTGQLATDSEESGARTHSRKKEDLQPVIDVARTHLLSTTPPTRCLRAIGSFEMFANTSFLKMNFRDVEILCRR